MPCLTSRVPNLQMSGPLIEVLIAPSTALRNVLMAKKEPIPNPMKAIFLVDTGATGSAMKKGIAQQLNLTQHGTITVATASHHNQIFPTYDVDIIFQHGVQVGNVRVFESAFEGQPIDGLIGRDVLRHGILIYSGYDQSFSLAF